MLSYTCDCKAPLGVGARLLRDQHDGRCNLGVLRDRQNEALTVSWDDGQTAMYSACDSASLRVYEPGACGTSVSDRFTCSECANLRISAIRWKCTNTGCKSKSITLCSQCYHGDLHDLSHTFRRVLVEPKVNMNLNLNLNLNPSRSSSLPLSWRASQQEAQTVTGERLYRRQGSRKVALQGVVPGAEVTRGLDWRWSDQDGGATGTVTGRDSWFDEADGVRVQWQWQRGGESKKYRMGCNGKTDVRMVRASPTPQYAYVDHLAPVDQHMIELWKRGDGLNNSVDCIPHSNRTECSNEQPRQANSDNSGDLQDEVKMDCSEGQHVEELMLRHDEPLGTFQVNDCVRIVSDVRSAHQDLSCMANCARITGRVGTVLYVENNGELLVNLGTCFAVVKPRDVVHAQAPADLLSTTDSTRIAEDGRRARGRVEAFRQGVGNIGKVSGPFEVAENRGLHVNTKRCSSAAGVLQRIQTRQNVSASRLRTESRLKIGDVVRIKAGTTNNEASRRNDSWHTELVGKVGRIVRIGEGGKVITRVNNRNFQLSAAVLTRVLPNSHSHVTEQSLQENNDQNSRHAATIISFLVGFLSEQGLQTETATNAVLGSSTDLDDHQSDRDECDYRKDKYDRENQSPKPKRKP